MREKKEMNEREEVYKERKNERRVDKHTHTERYTDTYTCTHINLSPMAGTVPDQGPGTG
jgi:hypothetical protein